MSLAHLDKDGFTEPTLKRAAMLSADLGVVFSLSMDFDELLAANEANRDSWDPLMPQFHPEYFDVPKTSCFWVKGIDSSGKVVAARAYRRFDLGGGRTLHDALLDLSLFYDDPSKAAPDEQLETSATTPRRISGSFAFSGALWVHPNARRLGLPALMKPIGRAAAYDRWNVPLLIALVEEVRKRSTSAQSENAETGIRWRGSYVAPECRFKLVWWTREEIAEGVDRFIQGGSSASTRK